MTLPKHLACTGYGLVSISIQNPKLKMCMNFGDTADVDGNLNFVKVFLSSLSPPLSLSLSLSFWHDTARNKRKGWGKKETQEDGYMKQFQLFLCVRNAEEEFFDISLCTEGLLRSDLRRVVSAMSHWGRRTWLSCACETEAQLIPMV